MKALGIDVGGTKIASVVYDKIIFSKTKTPTVIATFQINELLAQTSAQVIGLALPGIFENNKLVFAPNLHSTLAIDDLHSKKNLFLINDADAFAYGQFKQLKKYKNLCGITIGTGFGCGIVVNGQLISGAGEIGHTLINTSEHSTPITFETIVSGHGISEIYAKKTGQVLTAHEIIDLDSFVAREVIEHVATYLAYALANLIHTVKPECIVLGGSISPALFDYATRYTLSCLIHSSFTPHFILCKDEYAGAIGAALYAQDTQKS